MKIQQEQRLSTLRDIFEYSTARYADRTVSSFTDGSAALSYREFASKAREMSCLLSQYGVSRGDRVMLLSENMPTWLVAMFAIVNDGRVMVPVLPDCSANEVGNILAHSESKAAFVSRKQLSKLNGDQIASLSLLVAIEDFTVISSRVYDGPAVVTSVPERDTLAAILYTSGTSGNAKGVMLSHGNITHNVVVIAPSVIRLSTCDVFLSVLPAAHTYEMSLGEVFPFYGGACVKYVSRTPTPSVLLKAFAQVRPTAMAIVPLIIEKIYRKSVLKTIHASTFLSWMQEKLPAILYLLIGLKLRRTFGGRLRILAIGGAKLDSEVESFLKQAHFPYAIGYGMTETAPIIAAAAVGKTVVGSTGTAMPGVTVKLLDVSSETSLGEIVVKGPNVMLGYYKDPERTRESFTEDGWLHTKDLASVDSKGRYYIKGRLGNMILGSSGENVYPESIEEVIAGIEDVEESIVKCSNGHLVALVKMSDEAMDWSDEGSDEFKARLDALQSRILTRTNEMVSKASQLSSVVLVREPFEKTATKKIRRFLYQ